MTAILGGLCGTALGGFLGDIDLRLPFFVAAGLTTINWLYGFFVLPESLPPDRRTPFRWRTANPMGSLELLRSHPQLMGLAVAGFLSIICCRPMSDQTGRRVR